MTTKKNGKTLKTVPFLGVRTPEKVGPKVLLYVRLVLPPRLDLNWVVDFGLTGLVESFDTRCLFTNKTRGVSKH